MNESQTEEIKEQLQVETMKMFSSQDIARFREKIIETGPGSFYHDKSMIEYAQFLEQFAERLISGLNDVETNQRDSYFYLLIESDTDDNIFSSVSYDVKDEMQKRKLTDANQLKALVLEEIPPVKMQCISLAFLVP